MTPELKKVARVADVPEGRALAVEVEGNHLAIFNVEGELRAVEATCTRHGAPLEKGTVVDETLACPWHGVSFNLESGVCSAFPEEVSGVTYEVVVEGDDVFVRI
jgi:nitrite reductase/ring-hydroxylating ferredoxin subunit